MLGVENSVISDLLQVRRSLCCLQLTVKESSLAIHSSLSSRFSPAPHSLPVKNDYEFLSIVFFLYSFEFKSL